MLSSITALVSASLVFLVLDARTFRERMAGRLRTEAQIISFNSVSPLLFNDPDAAGVTLGGLRAESAVLAAAIFGQGAERPFAVYRREPAAATPLDLPPGGADSATVFARDHLLVMEPVSFEGKSIGRVLIQAELGRAAGAAAPLRGDRPGRARRVLPPRPRHLTKGGEDDLGADPRPGPRGAREVSARQGLLGPRRRPRRRRDRRAREDLQRDARRDPEAGSRGRRGQGRARETGGKRGRATSPPRTRSSRPSPTRCPTTCAPPFAPSTASARCCSATTRRPSTTAAATTWTACARARCACRSSSTTCSPSPASAARSWSVSPST